MSAAPAAAAPAQPAVQPGRRPRGGPALAVFAGALALCGAHVLRVYEPNKWLYADHSFYMNVTRGLAERMTLDQGNIHPRSWYDPRHGWNRNLDDAWSNISIGRKGTWYPKHPFLWPMVGVPFYLALGVHGTLVLNLLLAALIAALAYRVAARVAPPPAAAVAALLLPASHFWQAQSYGYSNDIFYTALLLGAVDAMLSARVGLAGFLYGLSVWAKMTNVLFAPAFALWLFLSRGGAARRRSLLRFSLGAAPPVGAFALANWIMFGAPWTTSYHRVLVVENGVAGVAAHTRLFTVPFWQGLQRELWSGPTSLKEVFPLAGLAVLGLGALCVSAAGRRLAAFVAAAAIPPLALLATYVHHRPQFLNPVVALSVPSLAALLSLLVPGGPALPVATAAPPLDRARLRRIAAACAGVFAALALGRQALRPDGSRLYHRVEEAQVFLGDVPCDYFNNQNERWECSHFDLGTDWTMTGRTLAAPPTFRGVPRHMIWMHAHPSGKPRRMLWTALPLRRRLVLEYGLADGARRGPVHVTATLDGANVLDERLEEPGELRQFSLDTRAGTTGRLEVSVVALADASYRQFCFDGRLEDR